MTSPRKVLVATLVCDRCVEERRRRRGVLAHVWKFPQGRVNVVTHDPRWTRPMRQSNPDAHWSNVRRGYTLKFPGYSIPQHDEFEMFCRYHGPGLVASSEVAAARGTVAVHLKAPT